MLSPFSALAQVSAPPIPAMLTLDETLRLAAERNPQFAAARAQVDVAEAQRLDARLRPNPAVTLDSIGAPHLSSGAPPNPYTRERSVRVDQEIETAGRRRLRIAAAEAGLEAARGFVSNEWRRLNLEVQRTYFQVVLAKADLEVSQAALNEIDRVITLNRARFEQGEISGGELRRVQVERLKFLDDTLAAELALRNAKAALLAIVTVPDLSREFDVAERLVPPGAPPRLASANQSPPVAEIRRQALAQRPDVAAARAAVRRAETETRLQRALRTPNVTVGGGYWRDRTTSALVVGVTVPLPLFNRNQGGLARAAAEQTIAASQQAAVEASVRLDVQQAVNAVEISQTRVDYIEREYLKNAREARDIVLASYRVGETDLINFLDAQRAFRDTLRTYNRALFDARVSEFQLAAAVGAPSEVK